MDPTTPTFPFALAALILVGNLLLLSIIFGGLFWWLRRKVVETSRQWTKEGVVFLYGPEAINFSGFTSKGVAQIRGNGTMALTQHDLRLARAMPAAEWRIPHQQIKSVSLESSFLGKRKGTKVLVITFDQDGRSDQVGVYVTNSTAWIEAITKATKGPESFPAAH